RRAAGGVSQLRCPALRAGDGAHSRRGWKDDPTDSSILAERQRVYESAFPAASVIARHGSTADASVILVDGAVCSRCFRSFMGARSVATPAACVGFRRYRASCRRTGEPVSGG